jgi:spore coat polysaccharide biosynthesis protein SpsF
MSERIIASIEARMGSSRLPGKVLMDIHGKPALARLVDRLRACRTLTDIVVATSTDPRDDALAEWAQAYGVAVFRGSEEDVLDRVAKAQASLSSDITVEITGDCPLLDPEVIDLGVESFLANPCDILTNARIESYPAGTDVQVYRLAALQDVAARINDPAVREHVTLYFYENPHLYRCIHLLAPASLRWPGLRCQLDYAEDLDFIRAVYADLMPLHGPLFGLPVLIDLLKRKPELAEINIHCVEKAAR